MSENRLAEFFAPRSIALIGATDKSRWSANTFANLRRQGFGGEVYLVNPSGGQVHGEAAYTGVAELPQAVDLAYVMVPTDSVMAVVKNLAERGIRNVAMLTAGFCEAGADGVALEAELLEFAEAHQMVILGPNSNGFINAAAGITPYGLPISGPLLGGPVGVVLHSGAVVTTVHTLTQARAIGLSLMVAMGNEANLSMTDVIEYLVADPDTRVITLFVELIRDPERFLAVAEKALRAGKPIIALKVGRSRIGARVARAHTGALVGDDNVIDAVFRQAGVIRVRSLEDLVTTAGLLAYTGILPGPNLGFITPSGGACELIADRAEDEELPLVAFTDETLRKLVEILPADAAPQNPLDVTGYFIVDQTLIGRGVHAVAADPGIDAVVLMVPELPREETPDIERYRVRAQYLADLARELDKPLIVLGHAMTDITDVGRGIAEETGYPYVLGGIEHGITALAKAAWWSGKHREHLEFIQQETPAAPPVTPEGASGTWTEARASNLLSAHGIPVVPHRIARTADEAEAAAEEFGYPVVLKLSDDGLAHKSDIDGVRLDIASAAEVRAHFAELVDVGRNKGLAAVTLLQPQRPAGVELLVGVVRDPMWGHVLTVGMGGVWVEVLKDVSLRRLPVRPGDVAEALASLRSIAMLQGARGAEAADLDRVVEVIEAVADLAVRLGEDLETLEINPLLVAGSQVEALDALITWRT